MAEIDRVGKKGFSTAAFDSKVHENGGVGGAYLVPELPSFEALELVELAIEVLTALAHYWSEGDLLALVALDEVEFLRGDPRDTRREEVLYTGHCINYLYRFL